MGNRISWHWKFYNDLLSAHLLSEQSNTHSCVTWQWAASLFFRVNFLPQSSLNLSFAYNECDLMAFLTAATSMLLPLVTNAASVTPGRGAAVADGVECRWCGQVTQRVWKWQVRTTGFPFLSQLCTHQNPRNLKFITVKCYLTWGLALDLYGFYGSKILF